jgi:hypothetical protein
MGSSGDDDSKQRLPITCGARPPQRIRIIALRNRLVTYPALHLLECWVTIRRPRDSERRQKKLTTWVRSKRGDVLRIQSSSGSEKDQSTYMYWA